MSEKKERVWADGLYFKAPNQITKDKAPLVKGHISVKVEDFKAVLDAQVKPDGWVNIDLKKSKEGGKLYLEVNTYQKAEEGPPAEGQSQEVEADAIPSIDLDGDIDPADLPF